MAQALRFHTTVTGNSLTLDKLDDFEGRQVEVIVMIEDPLGREGARQSATSTQRPLGMYRDLFEIPEDFDEPLPADILAAFEGEDDPQ